MSPHIAVTVGPACRAPRTLESLVAAGVRRFRLNLSQEELDAFSGWVEQIRRAARVQGREVTVMADLCGRRLRLDRLPRAERRVQTGQTVRLVGPIEGAGNDCLPLEDGWILEHLAPGHQVSLADGRVQLEVQQSDTQAALCRVVRGGRLRSHQGLNVPAVVLDREALPPRDRRAVQWALAEGIEELALSFVADAADLATLRQAVGPKPSVRVIAKIETQAAVEQLGGIVAAADEVLIARGDLGSQCGLGRIPRLQEAIVAECRRHQRPVILATGLLESLETRPHPTLAEVMDLAVALRQGIGTLLLTGQTAIGHHPLVAVETLAALCREIS